MHAMLEAIGFPMQHNWELNKNVAVGRLVRPLSRVFHILIADGIQDLDDPFMRVQIVVISYHV